ncbi:hypothetical protein LINPERHAP2_LOCUS36109 [Linum perenne]
MRRKRKEDDNGETGRKYFPWNGDLDQVLVQCFNILAEDKKIDAKGKFASGAYKELERLMEQERPGCGVKADPNIVSRCKTLKAKFLALQELRKHSHCAKLNRVPFPSYDGLAKVFDKVRATCESAIGMEELEKGCHTIEDAPSEAIPPEATNRAKKTRRSSSQVGSEIAELKPMIQKTINSLESMVEEENIVHKQRSMLYQELRKVEGLTNEQIWLQLRALGRTVVC